MSRLKIGDKVRVVGNHYVRGTSVENPSIKVGTVGIITAIEEDFLYPHRVETTDSIDYFIESDLELVEKTLEDLVAGDVVVDKNGIERTIIERLPKTVLLSVDNKDIGWNWMTIYELKVDGYILKSEIKEVTLKEVAEKFGVEEIRIKDE